MGQECVSCFIPCYEIANFQRRDEDKSTFILSFAYTQEGVQLRLYTFLDDICDSVRYLFLLFISLMVFGDTNNTMSTTSPYAFLVP